MITVVITNVFMVPMIPIEDYTSLNPEILDAERFQATNEYGKVEEFSDSIGIKLLNLAEGRRKK